MKRWRTVVLKILSIGLNVAGIAMFVRWLGRTDFMFGHFKGPPEWILMALGLCSVGLAAATAWIVLAIV